jgi:hypothetical protein
LAAVDLILRSLRGAGVSKEYFRAALVRALLERPSRHASGVPENEAKGAISWESHLAVGSERL